MHHDHASWSWSCIMIMHHDHALWSCIMIIHHDHASWPSIIRHHKMAWKIIPEAHRLTNRIPRAFPRIWDRSQALKPMFLRTFWSKRIWNKNIFDKSMFLRLHSNEKNEIFAKKRVPGHETLKFHVLWHKNYRYIYIYIIYIYINMFLINIDEAP